MVNFDDFLQLHKIASLTCQIGAKNKNI